MSASCVSPAINVCVPQLPKGAEAVSRVPRKDRPRWRVRLVLTDVSSMKTIRSGRLRAAGMRCLNQFARASLTCGRLRSSAMRLFFYMNTPDA